PRRADRDDLDDLDAGPPTEAIPSPFEPALDRRDDRRSPLSALFDDGDDGDDLDEPYDAPRGGPAFDGRLAPLEPLDPPHDAPRSRDRDGRDGRGDRGPRPADRDWPAPTPADRRPEPGPGPGPVAGGTEAPSLPRRGPEQPPARPAGPQPQRPPIGEPLGPPPTRPAAGAPGSTASGLQRRVRGAQLPMTEPVNLRRGRGSAGRPGDGNGRGDRGRDAAPASPSIGEPPEPNGDRRAADEVYGFLSSFTAGVQRGLDESRRDDGDERRRRTH
ncbi:MAG TPA: hypothetical protein VIL36_09650, partial [Acidimicrobiales bacterium]